MPRSLDLPLIGIVAAALVVALVMALVAAPMVKNLATRVKAMDIPKDDRHVHSHPIPHIGGLAIFLGFLLNVLFFLDSNAQVRGMLLRAATIVMLGIFDNIYPLRTMFRSVVQIITALMAVLSGNVIKTLSNPDVFLADPYWNLGALAVPTTVIWIVAITNAVNLIDDLDGLACDVPITNSMILSVTALAVSEGSVAILMAALASEYIGFLPYNMNPAKIFMGDIDSTFLGYILAVIPIQDLFRFYIIISLTVPFLMLGLPIFDTCSAFIRRIAHGQGPTHADHSHVHRRFIDMGFSQKQAAVVLYTINAILGPSAVVFITSGSVKIMLLPLVLCFAEAISARILLGANGEKSGGEKLGGRGEKR